MKREPQHRLSPALLTSLLSLLALLPAVGCSSHQPFNLQRDVQQEFDTNPKLRERGVVVKVLKVENGYVTANVRSGLSAKTVKAINEGRSLNEIYFFTDMSVSVLSEAEEILKKKPGIKAVMWTATVPQTTSKNR